MGEEFIPKQVRYVHEGNTRREIWPLPNGSQPKTPRRPAARRLARARWGSTRGAAAAAAAAAVAADRVRRGRPPPLHP